MPSPHEKVLAGEMLIALTIKLVSNAWRGSSGAPVPEQINGVVIVYALLALVALTGDGPARFAGALGGLVLLSIAVQRIGDLFSAAAGPAAAGGVTALDIATATGGIA